MATHLSMSRTAKEANAIRLSPIPVAAALIASYVLAGCGSLSLEGFASSGPPRAEGTPAPLRVMLPQRRSHDNNKAASEGIDAIARGAYADANRALGAAVALSPQSPPLNAANALSYHLRMRNGEGGHFALAETAYLAALGRRPDYLTAALQLAYLYQENGHYRQAQRAAAHVLSKESENQEALRLLAASSYYAGDIGLALWAGERLRKRAPNDRGVRRIIPMVYGAAGLVDDAERYIEESRPALGSEETSRLQQRLSQWKSNFRLARFAEQDDKPPVAATGKRIASLSDEARPEPGSGDASGESPSPNVTIEDGPGPIVYSWADCKQQLTDQQTPVGSASNLSGDETVQLPALPSPCKGRPLPKMAMVDVTILRTNEVKGSAYGVNLLESLSFFISRSITRKSSWTSAAPTWDRHDTIDSYVGLGSSAAGGLAYSLNIANLSGEAAEVIARPSLLVLDRQPAEFFSGAEMTIGLNSTLGTASIANKNIGVSLSVTPTFIGDDELLLNVKAARSFFEPTTPSATFQQSVQTSRNVVSASARIRFNETLILSGLSEREISSEASGVPVLKDVPLVQYLFSRKETQDFNKSVLILLTPRHVANYGATADHAGRLRGDERSDPALLREMRAAALQELGGTWPNLHATLNNMSRNRLLLGVRSNDIETEDWMQPQRIGRMLREALDMLYY